MYQIVEAVVKTNFYYVVLDQVRKYKAPLILKIHAGTLVNNDHAVESSTKNLTKEQHSFFPKTNVKAPVDLSELEFH